MDRLEPVARPNFRPGWSDLASLGILQREVSCRQSIPWRCRRQGLGERTGRRGEARLRRQCGGSRASWQRGAEERAAEVLSLSFARSRSGTMKAGRKNLKRASHGEEGFALQDGQSIVQVVSLRGSNIIEAPKKEKAPPPSSKPAKCGGGGKQKKKKWSKGKQKEKVNNAVLFDQATYDKILSEVPKYKQITPSLLPERLRGTMKAGRKNLKRASHGEEGFALQDGQSVLQVISLRGSNIIEVVDAKGVRSLALFPAKFQKSLWIKRGSFVVVDENGRKEALDSGNKVACIVLQVLFHEQVRALRKPETFRTTVVDDSCSYENRPEPQCSPKNMSDSDGEDGLAPLEANLNRSRPFQLYSDSGTDSDDTNADYGGSPA
ncbi:hypothetical protein Taro_005371 [Colocasia esculenta]|uniref:S1-like domain-containing protein n=1 Tax=Colocasia esculenta TaxID=4460 RepID=A0A843TS66_COLES|nr:hypothetical protein [Colocasia esculenta]